jgi:hypothetical protein
MGIPPHTVQPTRHDRATVMRSAAVSLAAPGCCLSGVGIYRTSKNPGGDGCQDMTMASQGKESQPRRDERPHPDGQRTDLSRPVGSDEFQWPGEEDMARLYGECAEEDRALAESGLEEYAQALAGMDSDDERPDV